MNPFRLIFETLVGGFDNLRLSSGEVLQSSTRTTDAHPRLLWKVSGWSTDSWQPYRWQTQWDIPAELVVQGPPTEAGPVLDALNDLYGWLDLIYGLPIDDKDQLVPFGPRQEELIAQKKLFAIADRFVGPYIKRATIRTGEANSSFTTVDLVFHVEFIVDNTPEVDAIATHFTVGANVNGGTVIRDPSKPFGYPKASQNDTRSQGAFAAPDTTLRINGSPVTPSFPPLVQGLPMVGGGDPSKTLQWIEIAPAAVIVTSSQQLQVIGHFQDGGTVSLTGPAAYVSSAPAVATVNSAGVVTKASVGTATITATFNGFSATSAITTA